MSQLPFDPLLLSLAAPLALALAIALGLPKRWSVRLAYVAFAIPALLALHVWWHFSDTPLPVHGYAFLTHYSTGLDGLGIGLTLGLNGISLPLFVLAGLVGFAAGLYALQSGAERLKIYLMLLLIMQAGLMGVFASVDVFFFYFFHELALIPTFIMVGVWGGRDRSYAAMKLTIYLTLGAMISLVGLIALYVKSGANSFDLIALRAHLAAHPLAETVQSNIAGLLLFGLGILVSLWPLHTWAPLGYGAAPSSAAMLHAGVLKKFGLYGLVQIALPLLPAGLAHWSHPLAWLAVIGNILVIGLITIAQRDLKQMIGYSSVMHMGYAFLGIAAGSVLGAGGVVLLMVAHGLSVALLFLLATAVHHRTHTFAMDEMGGLAQQAPVLAAFFVAATFASIGLPGFANFWGELTIFVALWQFSPLITALAVAGVVLSAIYGLRSAARVFFGPPTEQLTRVTNLHPVADLRWAEKIPALILLAALLFIGFWPKSLTAPLDAALSTKPVIARSDVTKQSSSISDGSPRSAPAGLAMTK
ncbi:MAG: NADH-quinone oxidoreductase subunit M [Opitutus sp.]|nr:NADH-quinone oxidoreductase subunit M [Opitutus sp.]